MSDAHKDNGLSNEGLTMALVRRVAEVRQETIEECARVAEHLSGWGSDCGKGGHAMHIAATIRALSPAAEEKK